MRYSKIFFYLFLIINPVLSISQDMPDKNEALESLHYQTFGHGIPILIINGGPGMNSQGFTGLAEKISSFGFSTIIYDQRGTGKSHINVLSKETMKMDLMVEDIEALREKLKIEKWVLMGHSFGGMLAYYYAVKFPERTLGMIQSSSGGMDLSLFDVFNITPFLSSVEQDSLTFYNQKIQAGDTTYATLLKRGEFMAPAYVYDRKHIPVIAHRLTQGNSQINSLIWQDLRNIKFDLKEDLKNFNKPTLIIQGKEDLLGTGLAVKAHAILPGSELVILNETRHYGWLDSPQHFYHSIEKFLNKQFAAINRIQN